MVERIQRRNFSAQEDLLLLRQVARDLPFLVNYGCMMGAWEDVAQRVRVIPQFQHTNLDGKKAQNRFHSLLDKHRAANAVKRFVDMGTGTAQEVQQLLDKLTEKVNQRTKERHSNSHGSVEANEVEDEALNAEEINEHASERRKRRLVTQSSVYSSASDDDTNTDNDNKEQDLSSRPKKCGRCISKWMIRLAEQQLELKRQELELQKQRREDAVRKLEFRKMRFELEMEVRRCEREELRKVREADREERLTLAKMEMEKTMAVINAILQVKTSAT